MNSSMIPDYAVPGPAVATNPRAELEPFLQRIRTLPNVARHRLRAELELKLSAAGTASDRRYYEQVIDSLHAVA